MTKPYFDSLSLTDYGFLALERPNLPMHIGGLALFKSGALRKHNSGVDFDLLRQFVAGILHEIPRYRQKLMWPNGTDHSVHNETWLEQLQSEPPVWVDDERFNLDFHVRHASLPRPGSDAQLNTLVGDIMSRPLDRSRPLWEMWVIEGLAKNHFAILYKIHHCIADGIASVELAQHLLSANPKAKPRRPKRFIPRPAPTTAQLRRTVQKQRVKHSLDAVREALHAVGHPMDTLAQLRDSLESTSELLGAKLQAQQSLTPVNGTPCLHRRVARCEISLNDIKAIKNAWHTTINNVVLVIVTGAIRRLLKQKKCQLENTVFRIGMPVNIRVNNQNDDGTPHNEISIIMLDLPVQEQRPSKQLELIVKQTAMLNKKSQSKAVQTMSAVMEFVPGLATGAMQSVAGPINSYVTNVPGPQQPLFTCGAKMLRCYPFAPLIGQIGFCIGVMSYDGQLCVGINADYELLANADQLAELLIDSFERTYRAAC